MTQPTERNLGEQPVAALLRERGISPHRLVEASPEPITHKMVSRACKGRWLTPNSRRKLLAALHALGETSLTLEDLFNYR